MADITVTGGTRPKSATPETLAPPLLFVHTANDSGDYLDTLVQYESLAPSPSTFTIASCATTSSSPTVTKTGAFANAVVRPGDSVSGTGIPGGTTVTAVTDNTLTLSANATATGTATLTFTPPTFNASMFLERRTFTMRGSTLIMNVKIYASDGKINRDADGNGSDDANLATAGTLVLEQNVELNLDAWLTAARRAKTVAT